MSIADTLIAARAALRHPVLNENFGSEFICLTIEDVAEDNEAARAAIEFLVTEMGMGTSGSHFIKRVQKEDVNDKVDGWLLACQAARYVLLDAAIFRATKLGV